MYPGKNEEDLQEKFEQLTESSASVGVLVLHDDAVDDLTELLEVGLQAFVGRFVVETSDEELAKDFTLGSGGVLVFPGRGLLDVQSLLVDRVRASLEAGLSLFRGREGDEPESAEKVKEQNVEGFSESNCTWTNFKFKANRELKLGTD